MKSPWEGSTSHQTIGPYPIQRMTRRASRPGATGPDGNIVPEEFGKLRWISVAADPKGNQTHRRRHRTTPRCDLRPASGWYHLDVPRRSGDPGRTTPSPARLGRTLRRATG